MSRSLPAVSQIQDWILGIQPYPYFENLVESPGLLVLRAKGPLCDFQGIHIALSDRRKDDLIRELMQLRSKEVRELKYRSSHPDGRAWFNLYTSGIDFGNWSIITFSLDDTIQDGELWVRFISHSTVHFRMNAATLLTVIDSLKAANPNGGLKTELRLIREQKPTSKAHHLWFWHWREYATSR